MTLVSAQSVNNASNTLIVTFSFISLFSSILLLFLLHYLVKIKLSKWNLYNRVIYMMNLSQIVYDIALVGVGFAGQSELVSTEIGLQFLLYLSGLSVSLWTNIITCMLLYTCLTYGTLDYGKVFPLGNIIANGLPLILSIVYVCGAASYSDSGGGDSQQIFFNSILSVYYYSRMISILINVVVYIVILLLLHKMAGNVAIVNEKEEKNNVFGNINDPAQSFSDKVNINSEGSVLSIRYEALKILAFRVRYYATIQILTRVGAAWYEYAYILNSQSSNPPAEFMPTQEAVSSIIYSISTPSAGLGYLLVFLLVQPVALRALIFLIVKTFQCRCQHHCSKPNPRLSTLDANNSSSSSGSGGNEVSRRSEGTSGSRSSIKWPFSDSVSESGFRVSSDGWKTVVYDMDEDTLCETIHRNGIVKSDSNIINSPF